jgi:hypothetical protein
MNERIEELYKQSFIEVQDENSFPCMTFSKQKFAELIVLECVNAVMDGTKEGDHYAMRIEQHFDNGQGGIVHFGVDGMSTEDKKTLIKELLGVKND